VRLPYPLRAAAARLIRSVPVRIRSGPNAGAKWSLASSGRGARAGTFEAERMQALEALVRPGEHVWDLGAHKGYVSLVLSRIVGPDGSVTAVEPSSQNLWFLRTHLRWNDIDNVTVVRAAASGTDGTARFGGTGSTIQFHLGEGDETVRTMTLPGLLEDGAPRPSVVKMDIEGAEADALRAAGGVLDGDTLVFVSTHSREQYEECSEELGRRGFTIYESRELARLGANPDLPWQEDPELLAVGPDRELGPDVVHGLRLFRGASCDSARSG